MSSLSLCLTASQRWRANTTTFCSNHLNADSNTPFTKTLIYCSLLDNKRFSNPQQRKQHCKKYWAIAYIKWCAPLCLMYPAVQRIYLPIAYLQTCLRLHTYLFLIVAEKMLSAYLLYQQVKAHYHIRRLLSLLGVVINVQIAALRHCQVGERQWLPVWADEVAVGRHHPHCAYVCEKLRKRHAADTYRDLHRTQRAAKLAPPSTNACVSRGVKWFNM